MQPVTVLQIHQMFHTVPQLLQGWLQEKGFSLNSGGLPGERLIVVSVKIVYRPDPTNILSNCYFQPVIKAITWKWEG